MPEDKELEKEKRVEEYSQALSIKKAMEEVCDDMLQDLIDEIASKNAQVESEEGDNNESQ